MGVGTEPRAPGASGEGDEFVLYREMGCTREEFAGWLPGATRHAALSVGTDGVSLEAGGGIIEISFVPGRTRNLGSVSIPVLNVTFRFRGVGSVPRGEFMAYFDLYTKRGGG
jgi:hypothetical protein